MQPHLTRLDRDWALWRTAAVRGAGMPFEWLDRLVDDEPDPFGQLLREPAFVAALTWQNPKAVRAWVGAAARAADGGSPRINAYRAGVLARYAQRYCAKNDSIGFFGSVGWATVDEHAERPLRVTGTGRPRSSVVAVEQWAVEAVARAAERDDRLFGDLPVRLTAATSYADGVLRVPRRPPVPVIDGRAEVLDALLRGQVRVADLAGRLPELLALREQGAVSVGFSIPVADDSFEQLRAQVAALPASEGRDELLTGLARIEENRAVVAEAAHDPASLPAALKGLDDAFTTMAGIPASRDKGTASAGRTIAYLDCRRDLDVTIGAGLLDALRAPLALLLDSARWFTNELAQAVHEVAVARYEDLRTRSDGTPVTLDRLQFALSDVLTGAEGTPVHEVAEDFRLRWAEILPVGHPGAEEVVVGSSDIAPLVSALFSASHPGWVAARVHSPDLLLADVDGDRRWVVGELHLAMNTLESRFFHTLHDDQESLVAATAADMVTGRVVPCYPSGPDVDSRRYPPLAVRLPEQYLYWSFGADAEPVRSHPATALRVHRSADGLVVGDGSWALPVVEFFGEFLTGLVVNRFALGGPGPRVLIDDVVVKRRSWALSSADLPPGVVARRGVRPEPVADLLRDLGAPRHLFARTPVEPKPFLVDTVSALSVRNLIRAWRKIGAGQRLDITEMLPGPDALWLTDDCGRRHTSEFRMVAVDQLTPRRLGIASIHAAHHGKEF